MVAATPELQDAIAAANRDFMDTFGRGDAAGMAELYTEDGQLLPTNSDFVIGKPAVEGFWQAVIDMGVKTATLATVELEGEGDTAIEVGQYTLGGANDEVLDQGKYVVIWKNDGGKWKLHRDIWNTSMPVPE